MLGTQCLGFQFLLILDLWGISFHAVVVFGLGKNLLFKSVLGHCERQNIAQNSAMFVTPLFDTIEQKILEEQVYAVLYPYTAR